MPDQSKIVIIGNSAAGLSAVKTLRVRDGNCRITLISRERGPAYSLVLLPHFISGKIDQSGLMLANDAFYRDLPPQIGQVVGADLSDADKQKIFHDNAARILG